MVFVVSPLIMQHWGEEQNLVGSESENNSDPIYPLIFLFTRRNQFIRSLKWNVVFCVVFSRQLFVFLPFLFWLLYCLSFLYVCVKSINLSSFYNFFYWILELFRDCGNFSFFFLELQFLIAPLVSSNLYWICICMIYVVMYFLRISKWLKSRSQMLCTQRVSGITFIW